MFALVKWVSGREKDTYTVVSADWVVDIDVLEFDNTKEKECVIEWRVKNKKAKHFEVYDAVLVRTSEKEQELKRVMHELEDDEACLDKRPTKMPKRLEDASRPTDNAKSAKVSRKFVRDTAAKSRAEDLLGKISSSGPSDDSSTKRIFELQAENAKLKSILIDSLPKLMTDVSEMLPYVRRQFSVSASSSSTGTSDGAPLDASPSRPNPSTAKNESVNSNTSLNDKVPIYPGSNVLVSRSALSAVRQASTATAMARMLLLAVFDMPTLLSSNLKGGASKRPDSDDGTRLQRLDEEKLEAIFCTCQDKFPGTSTGLLGAAINGKLTELRLKAKKL